MKQLWSCCVAVIALLGSGCSDGTITEEDTHQIQREFSGSNYEREMKRLGRTKELEEERARARAREDDERVPSEEHAAKLAPAADDRSERE